MLAEVTNTYLTQMTPDLANTWLQQYHYEYQRKAAKTKVAAYAAQMADGKWMPGTSLKLGIVDGAPGKMLLDGRHRLLALVEAGITQVFAVTEVRCATEEQLAKVYATTDRGRARSIDDLFRTTHLSQELGLTAKQTRKAGGALQLVAADFKPWQSRDNPLDYDDLLAAFRNYGAAIEAFVEATNDTPHRLLWEPLYRSATLSIGIVTYHYAATVYGRELVDRFWHGVAFDDGLRNSDPRKYANLHIATTRISRVGGGHVGHRMVSTAWSARYIADCWNKWSEGGLYSGTASGGPKGIKDTAPIKISGTPWKG